MTAGRLREAARVLQERAEAANDWNLTDGRLWVVDHDPSDPTGQTAMQRVVGGADEPWASYIATMHPGIGLALAELLEHIAADEDDDGMGCADTTVLAQDLADLILGGTVDG